MLLLLLLLLLLLFFTDLLFSSIESVCSRHKKSPKEHRKRKVRVPTLTSSFQMLRAAGVLLSNAGREERKRSVNGR